MHELLRDFLAESAEQLGAVKAQLTRVDFDFGRPSRLRRRLAADSRDQGSLRLSQFAEARSDRSRRRSPSGIDERRGRPKADGGVADLGGDRSHELRSGGPRRSSLRAPGRRRRPHRPPRGGRPAITWFLAWGLRWGALLETPLDAASTPPERRVDAIRVSLQSIERIDCLVADLIMTQNQLLAVAGNDAFEPLRAPLRRLSTITGDLQSEALAARMQPIGRLFPNLKRLAHDVAADLGRIVQLSLEGGDILLDRQLFGPIREALAHLIRDAIDHGIETPEERRRLGKPDAGQITVLARSQVECAVITVRDDGRGFDADTPDPSRRSTRGDDGVGNVRAALEDIGGCVALEGRPGEGSTTTLRIPIATVALSALIVEAGADRFAVDRRIVEDLVTVASNGDACLEPAPGGLFLRVRGDRTPAARLSVLMQSPIPFETPAGSPVGLLMRVGDRRFAIVVDAVSGVQDLVLKALPQPMRHLTLFSGAAILRDGSAALVLSPSGLADALGAAAGRGDDAADEPRGSSHMISAAPRGQAENDRRTRLLVIEPAMPVRRMLDQTLTRAGYEVRFAATLDEALDTLPRSADFDGALADLELAAPAEAGTKRWDKFRRAGFVQLLALADHGGESVQRAARGAGFDAAAGKFDRGGLLNALRASGLESSRLRSAA